MITFTSVQVSAWYGAVFWPLIRILALFSTAPVLSHRSLPVRIRVALALGTALLVAPQVDSLPIDAVLSAAGALAVTRNLFIGFAVGFSAQVIVAGIETAGELVGLQIGLSFAGFFNPATAQTQTPISVLLSTLSLMLFLALDGHLALIDTVAESFRVFPVAAGGGPELPILQLAALGAPLYSLALSLALPFIAVMLLTNALMGIMSRVAPQLSLISIGFPLTVSAGLVSLWLFLPALQVPLRAALESVPALSGVMLEPGTPPNHAPR